MNLRKAFVLLLALPSALLAAGPPLTLKPGGVAITIPLPDGFVLLSQSDPRFQATRQFMPANIQLEAMLVDPKDAADPKVNFKRYHMVQTMPALNGLTIPPAQFKSMVDDFERQVPSLGTAAEQTVNQQMNNKVQQLNQQRTNKVEKLKLGETRMSKLERQADRFTFQMWSHLQFKSGQKALDATVYGVSSMINKRNKVMQLLSYSLNGPADEAWTRNTNKQWATATLKQP